MSLAVNQKLTGIFIEDDPSMIILVPHARVKTPSGSFKNQAGEPRSPQTVKIIYQESKGEADDTSDGAVRKQRIVIVGLHDADIDEGDTFYWPHGGNKKWVVTGIHPPNGYEVKADAVVYGIGGRNADQG